MALMFLIYLMKIRAALLLYLDINLNLWILLGFSVKVLAAIMLMGAPVIMLMTTPINEFMTVGVSRWSKVLKQSSMICCSLSVFLSVMLIIQLMMFSKPY